MVENRGGLTASKEIKSFFRKAIKAEIRKEESQFNGDLIFTRNITAIFCLTGASTTDIAKAYNSDAYGIEATIRYGLHLLRIKSSEKIRKRYVTTPTPKYSVRETQKRVEISKDRVTDIQEPEFSSQIEPETTNEAQSASHEAEEKITVLSKDVDAIIESVPSIEENGHLSEETVATIEETIPVDDGETSSEFSEQFTNDLEIWNEAVKQDLLGKLNKHTNVAALSAYFANGGNSRKPTESDLEDLSLVVAKYAK